MITDTPLGSLYNVRLGEWSRWHEMYSDGIKEPHGDLEDLAELDDLKGVSDPVIIFKLIDIKLLRSFRKSLHSPFTVPRVSFLTTSRNFRAILWKTLTMPVNQVSWCRVRLATSSLLLVHTFIPDPSFPKVLPVKPKLFCSNRIMRGDQSCSENWPIGRVTRGVI